MKRLSTPDTPPIPEAAQDTCESGYVPASAPRFASSSLRLDRFDAASNTLHTSLLDERPTGGHGFEFQADFAAAPGVVTVSVGNASRSLYPSGWTSYAPFVLRGDRWIRTAPGALHGGAFTFRIDDPCAQLAAAWYEPYSVDRALDQTRAAFDGHPRATVEIDDDGFAVARLGDVTKQRITVIGRQHPGESISSFFVEGFTARAGAGCFDALLDDYGFVIAPLANVDGVRHGRHRHDTAGADYNRNWRRVDAPAPVAAVRRMLSEADNVLLADIHGDEVSAVSFVSCDTPSRRPVPQSIAELLQLTCAAEPTTYHLPTPHPLKRLIKGLIQRRRIVLFDGTTATEYAAKSAACIGLTYELSARALTPAQAYAEGERFAGNLADVLARRDRTERR